MANKDFHDIPSFVSAAFGNDIELLSSVDELFELEMVWQEFNCLKKNRYRG
jgi:hypothetical protein